MKLYDSRRAPNPRRVRWVMAEKGITAIEVIQVDILKDEHRDPAYLKRAGIAHVPALEIDAETTITESIAICRFLESLYPEPNLFGRDPRETATVEMWTRRAEMSLATPLMLAVRHTHPALAKLERQNPDTASENRAAADRALRFFDRRLENSAFIGADRVTIADVVAFIGLDFARMIQFRPDAELTNVSRWTEAMRARPASAAGV